MRSKNKLALGSLFLAGILNAGTEKNAFADYVLANGETKSFATADEFGSLSQAVTGPTAEGSMAYLNFTNTSEIRILTSQITGNLTLTKTGSGYVRMNNANSSFSGPVYLSDGAIYLYHGTELGTGTIYLQGGTISNGGDGWGNGRVTKIENDIVFVDGKSGHVRIAHNNGLGYAASFYGTLSGAGDSNWGSLSNGYLEPDPGTVNFYGESELTGNFIVQHSGGKAALFNIYNTSGLGNVKINAKSNTKIDFQKAADGSTINRTITPASITVAKDTSLTFANTGGGKSVIQTSILKGSEGTVVLTGANLDLLMNFPQGGEAFGNIKIQNDASLTLQAASTKTITARVNLSGDGTLNLVGEGNMIRFQNQNNSAFTGDVRIPSGRVYLSNGKELGTGTIYLGGAGTNASLQNNNSNIDLPNDIVLVDGTTSYLRPYAAWSESKFRGDITGSGNLVYGRNGYTHEHDNSLVSLYGTNSYTGTTTVDQAGGDAYRFNVYGKQPFGTGALTFKNNASVTFKTNDVKVANASVTNESEKTLTLTNSSEGEASILGTVSNAGTITLNDGTISFAKDIANAGTFTVQENAILGVGAGDAGSGTQLNITGAGTFNLNGGVELSIFSPTDYDSLKFANTQNFSLGDDVWILLEMPADTSSLAGKVVTLDAFNGLSDPSVLEDLAVSFNQPNWHAFVNANGQIVLGDSNALPEPSTFVLLLTAVGIFCVWRKKK